MSTVWETATTNIPEPTPVAHISTGKRKHRKANHANLRLNNDELIRMDIDGSKRSSLDKAFTFASVPMNAMRCETAKPGYYCDLDNKKGYVWCPGSGLQAISSNCPENTVCHCAYTNAQPCQQRYKANEQACKDDVTKAGISLNTRVKTFKQQNSFSFAQITSTRASSLLSEIKKAPYKALALPNLIKPDTCVINGPSSGKIKTNDDLESVL